jgi:hypothetical protein
MFSRRVLALATLALLPVPAYGAETLWKEIIVRVYDSTGASAAERRGALAIAASIVSVASLELIWRTCSEPASAPHRNSHCDKPLAPGELALRIVRSRVTDDRSRAPQPLGEALIDTRTRSGVLATVFIDRVESMAAQTGDRRDLLLGRAIAHELGHLLMATSAHSAHGLMRPLWTQSEIRGRARADWTFGSKEIAAIRAHAGAREKSPVASGSEMPVVIADEVAALWLDSIIEPGRPVVR